MKPTRRQFLIIAGFSAAGVLCPSVARLVASKPEPREIKSLTAKRWAMAVDAAKCRADCTDCFKACHAAHNVPDIGNTKEEVKWIWPERFDHVFHAESQAHIPEAIRTRPVPVLCNHCDNPPCVRVCPTGATFRRPDGIVMMDSHRCIGCKICLAACPYGARSINFRNPRPYIARLNPEFPTRSKGVIEKCNFCEERLARDLMPACVLACPEKALVFGDVEDPRSEIRQLLDKQFTLRRRAELGTKPQVYYTL